MASPWNHPAPNSAGVPGERRRLTSRVRSAVAIPPRSSRMAAAKPESRVFRWSHRARSERADSQGSGSKKSWASWAALSRSIARITPVAPPSSQAQQLVRIKQHRR